jgi:hypothetical protein
VQGQLGHGKAFAVPCPESGLIPNGACGQERVGHFDAVAIAVLAKELSGEMADFESLFEELLHKRVV